MFLTSALFNFRNIFSFNTVNDVATELQALLDDLNTAVAKGDMGVVHDTLEKGNNHLAELIPKIESQKSREVITVVKTNLDELISKLSDNKANMDDVHAFLTDAKEKLKQRLADKMKEMSN